MPYTLTPPDGIREYPDKASRAESYWHEHTVWPDTGSVIIGRPFSQQLDGVDPAAVAAAEAAAAAAAAAEVAAAAGPPPVADTVAAALDTCDMAPGLRAPI